MSKIIPTYNISLDTSFFEQNNFLVGTKMRELAELCQKGAAFIFITDITYREVIARFRANLIVADEKIKKPKEQLVICARVLRNFPEMSSFFDWPSVDIDALSSRFQMNFEEWLKKNKATIIPTDHITIKDVFNDYFENKPPFKEGKKKHEFPDAFTLKALVEYFLKKRTKSYLLSSDRDLLTLIHKTIIPIEDPSLLFDLIIRTTPEKITERAIKLIEDEFINSRVQLEKETMEMLIRTIEDEVGSTYQINEIEIDSVDHVNVSNIELSNFSIVSLNTTDQSAKLVCEINFSFEVSFSADDYSEAWHDNEDDIWHFVESKTFSFEDTYNISVEIRANFDTDEEFVELELKDINNGNKLNVMDSFKHRNHRH